MLLTCSLLLLWWSPMSCYCPCGYWSVILQQSGFPWVHICAGVSGFTSQTTGACPVPPCTDQQVVVPSCRLNRKCHRFTVVFTWTCCICDWHWSFTVIIMCFLFISEQCIFCGFVTAHHNNCTSCKLIELILIKTSCAINILFMMSIMYPYLWHTCPVQWTMHGPLYYCLSSFF